MVWGNESIGHRIRHLRLEMDWSQGDLGGRTNLSEDTIDRIENDWMDIRIHREFLERICHALGVSIEEVELSEAQIKTRQLLDAMYLDSAISREDAELVMESAKPKLRSSFAKPLNVRAVKSLLEILKGE